MERLKGLFAEPNEKYNMAIRVALRFANCTLLKYYHLTDVSETYVIAMGEGYSVPSSDSCDTDSELVLL